MNSTGGPYGSASDSGQPDFTVMMGTTIHETMHAAGLDHVGLDPAEPENAPYQPGLWNDTIQQIEKELPSSVYDPATGQNAPLKT
jgi:hypothetical protein